jgi:hypothetical protein
MSFGDWLADLDELALRCQHERARGYLSEAIGCYRAGAFRACIVSTWIAVAFDFIDKLRELDLSGDLNAHAKLEEFDRIRTQNDLRRSLEFERGILELARDSFELLSPLEYSDMKRLFEDRNRCAHPSMIALDQAYQAEPELARLHMVNAVNYLLGRPPVQGKAAMDRLVHEIESQYFPTETSAAVQHFRHGPLARPRDALVRNLVILLSKKVLLESIEDTEARRIYAAISAIREMHREVTEAVLFDMLSDLMRRVEDDALPRALGFLRLLADSWQYLRADVRARLEAYVRNMPGEGTTHSLGFAVGFPPLQGMAIQRVASLEDGELAEILEKYHGPALLDRAIALYIEANSFNEANRRANLLILPVVQYFSSQQVERIIRGAASNSQILGSFQVRPAILALRESERMPRPEFDQLLEEVSLVVE